jgi:hypothetical protein
VAEASLRPTSSQKNLFLQGFVGKSMGIDPGFQRKKGFLGKELLVEKLFQVVVRKEEFGKKPVKWTYLPLDPLL